MSSRFSGGGFGSGGASWTVAGGPERRRTTPHHPGGPLNHTADHERRRAPSTARDPAELDLLMRVFDDTATDVVRMVELVLHRATRPLSTTPRALAVATYLAVLARIETPGDEPLDRAWVLSTAHALARGATPLQARTGATG